MIKRWVIKFGTQWPWGILVREWYIRCKICHCGIDVLVQKVKGRCHMAWKFQGVCLIVHTCSITAVYRHSLDVATICRWPGKQCCVADMWAWIYAFSDCVSDCQCELMCCLFFCCFSVVFAFSNWRAPWKNWTSRYISFLCSSLNGVLFPMFCLLVEGECQILVLKYY